MPAEHLSEPVTIVEIDQDFCSRTYGTAPCQAALGVSGQAKCYNTFATCQDLPNYRLRSPALTLKFKGISSGRFRDEGTGVYYPCLTKIQYAPSKLNISGQSRTVAPLGSRTSVSLTFRDFVDDDTDVDPYISERRAGGQRGTFWRKWKVRNRYYRGRFLRVITGDRTQPLSTYQTRHYVIDKFTGPQADGSVAIVAKDVLNLATNSTLQVPRPSLGSLLAGVTKAATRLTVSDPDDYWDHGFIRINDEILGYVKIGGGTLHLGARGAFGSKAAAHELHDPVQQVWQSAGRTFTEVLADLLTTYAKIPIAFLAYNGSTDQWDREAATWLLAWNPKFVISVPTPVKDLLAELCSLGPTIWWDEKKQKIFLRGLYPANIYPPAADWNDKANFLPGGEIKEIPREHATRVIIHYDPRDHTASHKDGKNYAAIRALADFDKETPYAYNTRRDHHIYCRWLNLGDLGVVVRAGYYLLQRWSSYPEEMSVILDSKDRDVWLGDIVRVTSSLDLSPDGTQRERYWTVISAREDTDGRVRYLLRNNSSRYDLISSTGSRGRVAFITSVRVLTKYSADATFSKISEADKLSGCWLARDHTFNADGSINTFGTMPDGTPGYSII